ncbi:hypothetical protein GCM10009837_49570 [Streptomyces durmitorensis]
MDPVTGRRVTAAAGVVDSIAVSSRTVMAELPDYWQDVMFAAPGAGVRGRLRGRGSGVARGEPVAQREPWKVRLMTSSCWSRVRRMKLTA